MADFAALESCGDLNAEMAARAARDAADLAALFRRVAQIARPGDGCPKILLAIAAASTQSWLEGDLRVELEGDGDATNIALIYDHGFGIRERMMPLLRLRAPIDEFLRAVKLAPQLVAPMEIVTSDGRLVLTPRGEARTDEPTSIRIHSASINPDPAPDPRSVSGVTKRHIPGDKPSQPAQAKAPEMLAANGGPQPAPNRYDPHTHPTRKMQRIDPEILRAATARDPRRDRDE